jgi:hypothetical protein
MSIAELYSKLQPWALQGAPEKLPGGLNDTERQVSLLCRTASQFHKDRAEDMMLRVERFLRDEGVDLKAKGNEKFAEFVGDIRQIHTRLP